jgi:hypothetical protein
MAHRLPLVADWLGGYSEGTGEDAVVVMCFCLVPTASTVLGGVDTAQRDLEVALERGSVGVASRQGHRVLIDTEARVARLPGSRGDLDSFRKLAVLSVEFPTCCKPLPRKFATTY